MTMARRVLAHVGSRAMRRVFPMNLRGRVVPALLALTGAVLLAPTNAYADDIVFLKGGGRVRGTVIEEDPKAGVRIKLADGSFRTVTHAQVDRVEYAPAEAPPPVPVVPAPAAAAVVAPTSLGGRLVVTGTAPGNVFLDRGQVGRTPLDLPAVPAGFHRVTVEFDGGGNTTKLVTVIANQTTEVAVERSASAGVFAYRSGVHLGVTADGLAYAGDLKGIGGGVMPFVNFGLSPGIDLRLGAMLNASNNGRKNEDATGGSAWSFGGSATLRVNLGSFYTMSIGGRFGYMHVKTDELSEQPSSDGTFVLTPVADVRAAAFVAGEVSPLTFRFGPHREIEAGYDAVVGAIPGKTHAFLDNELQLTYLFTQF
jgi:hypothetical protein